MNTLVPSFLIGSSLVLQVTTRTCLTAWMSSNFGKFLTELRPLIDVRIKFLLNILKTNRPIKTKYCIHIIIDKIYFAVVNHCFLQICDRVLIDVRILFLLHILRTNRQIETKFCTHIIIDKIYFGNVNLCFSQIYNRVMALD